MYCRMCGKKMEEGDKFCGNCGTKVINKTEGQKTNVEFDWRQDTTVAANKPRNIERGKVHFDWNLDGFPSEQPKKTDTADFNWSSVIDEKDRERYNGFYKEEPKQSETSEEYRQTPAEGSAETDTISNLQEQCSENEADSQDIINNEIGSDNQEEKVEEIGNLEEEEFVPVSDLSQLEQDDIVSDYIKSQDETAQEEEVTQEDETAQEEEVTQEDETTQEEEAAQEEETVQEGDVQDASDETSDAESTVNTETIEIRDKAAEVADAKEDETEKLERATLYYKMDLLRKLLELENGNIPEEELLAHYEKEK